MPGLLNNWKIGPFSAAQHQQKNERKSALLFKVCVDDPSVCFCRVKTEDDDEQKSR